MGAAAITAAFETARAEQRAAIVPYQLAGWPTAADAVDLAVAMVDAGADVLEIGMPFSDPLADGPTIQQAATESLAAGTTTADAIGLVEQLRARGVTVPLILMGYVNPILAMGVTRFVERAAAAGADGLIVADLPPEEATHLRAAADAVDLALVPLVAPTGDDERLATVLATARGMAYCVSVAGTTGARTELPADVVDYLDRARRLAPVPTVVGFGIATADHVARVAPHADGAVCASAIIDAVRTADSPAARTAAAAAVVADLRRGAAH